MALLLFSIGRFWPARGGGDGGNKEVATLLKYYQAHQAELKRGVYESDEGAWFVHEQKLTDRCLVRVRGAAMRDLKVTPWMSWEQVLEVISITVRQRKTRDG